MRGVLRRGVPASRTDRPSMPIPSAFTPSTRGGRLWTGAGRWDVGWIGLPRARPRPDVEIGALVGRPFAHVGVAVGAEHVDRAGDGLAAWPLTGHQHDAGLHLVADTQDKAD